MERYDYREQVLSDVKDYIDEHKENFVDWDEMDANERFDALYDDMFISDSVTGNASGSYTFNAWEAEENLCHNLDLLAEALDDFGSTIFESAEANDVTIRCYLLSECLIEALEDYD